MKNQCGGPLVLRFFDLEVSLSSSDPSILRPFQILYSAFHSGPSDKPASQFMRVEFQEGESDPRDSCLTIDGTRWPVSEAMCRSGALYEFLLKCIYERSQSHILIHSSALSLNGAGVLLVGDSGFGKSTLALSLANRGAGFFSDEVGAIHRGTGRLEAFPRRMRVRDESLVLAGLKLNETPLEAWYGKRLLNVEDIRQGIIASPCPISAVVFLTDYRELNGGLARRDSSVIEFLLDRCDAELMDFVSRLRTVEAVDRDDSSGFSTLSLRGESVGNAAAELEAYCRDRRICVLDAASPVRIKPDFSAEPTLISIDAKHAYGRLLQQFLPGRGSCILREEYEGKSTRLLLEMMSLFKGVSFFDLVVGDMRRMVELVESVASFAGGRTKRRDSKMDSSLS